jgi:hypothetical protein
MVKKLGPETLKNLRWWEPLPDPVEALNAHVDAWRAEREQHAKECRRLRTLLLERPPVRPLDGAIAEEEKDDGRGR